MALEHTTARRRGRAIPFVTIFLAVAFAIGLAAGLYSLRTAPNTSTIAAVTVPATLVVPTQACQAMGATARQMYCSPAHETRIAPPRVTWQACHAMDANAYRQYCQPGDGGRWLQAQ